MWSFMSAVFSLAVDDGELAVNPCTRGGRLYAGTRVEKIWSQDQIDAMLKVEGYKHLRLPLMIALWTGLHQGDILRLDWSEYDGKFLRVNQRKGRRHGHAPKILEVPVAPTMRALLKKERLHIGPICRSSEGQAVDSPRIPFVLAEVRDRRWRSSQGDVQRSARDRRHASLRVGRRQEGHRHLHGA
jgi:integrase